MTIIEITVVSLSLLQNICFWCWMWNNNRRLDLHAEWIKSVSNARSVEMSSLDWRMARLESRLKRVEGLQ